MVRLLEAAQINRSSNSLPCTGSPTSKLYDQDSTWELEAVERRGEYQGMNRRGGQTKWTWGFVDEEKRNKRERTKRDRFEGC